MNNFSTTQASNIGVFVGVLVIILKYFKINIASEELQTIIGAAITVVSGIISFINRYKKGDLTVVGMRK